MSKIKRLLPQYVQKSATDKTRRGSSGTLNLEPGLGDVTSFAYDPVTGRDFTVRDLIDLQRPFRKKFSFKRR